MIRISLPWLVEVVRAVDALGFVSAGMTFGSVGGAAYTAKTQLESLFLQSFYSGSLRSSRRPAENLAKTLSSVLEGESESVIGMALAWQLQQNRDQFRTVFLAELGTLPSYYVLQKPPYDTNSLLDAGETLMPNGLGAKVPEALFDAKEAGKALAFEMGTACGFHSFRLLESVIRKYLTAIGASETEPKSRNLGVYIRSLEGLGADKAIVAALQQLKDNHRNPLIHPEAAIPVEESIAIIGMVRSVVSAMLKEIEPPPPTTMSASVAQPLPT